MSFLRRALEKQRRQRHRLAPLQSHTLRSGLTVATSTVEDASRAGSEVAAWAGTIDVGLDVQALLSDEHLCGLGLTAFEVAVSRRMRSASRLVNDLRAVRDELYPLEALLAVLDELDSLMIDEPDGRRRHELAAARVARVERALRAGERFE